MTIERLPREYPIGSTVWTNKGYGTVLVRLGEISPCLVAEAGAGISQPLLFLKKYSIIYIEKQRKEFSNDLRSAESSCGHSGVLFELGFL